MEFKVRNVNEAFEVIVTGMHKGTIPVVSTPSRVGNVLMIPEPVTVTYTHPLERVLFNEARDANPFFHLFESLWMLAGRNDVAPLAYFNSKIADIASDDGKTFNGAYGYRWRHAIDTWGSDNERDHWGEVDQLQILIDHLRNNPNSRRAVLQMWNVDDDLLKVDSSKDVCCNTCVYFSIRVDKFPDFGSTPGKTRTHLDMTVCNRSNDLIWGMLGANVVHFSFLQEYIANCLDLGVGVYNQFTNNLHVYENNWEPEKWLAEYRRDMHSPEKMDYVELWHTQLVQYQEVFDKEVKELIDFQELRTKDTSFGFYHGWNEPFLDKVADPMYAAFQEHKNRRYDNAKKWMNTVEADDWKYAGMNWLEKRESSWLKKKEEV
jgi:thymidylate synthase